MDKEKHPYDRIGDTGYGGSWVKMGRIHSDGNDGSALASRVIADDRRISFYETFKQQVEHEMLPDLSPQVAKRLVMIVELAYYSAKIGRSINETTSYHCN